MSSPQRQINIHFERLVQSNAIRVQAREQLHPLDDALELTAMRASAIVKWDSGAQASTTLQMRVLGMTLNQIHQFSSAGSQLVDEGYSSAKVKVKVVAGDVGSPLSNVFEGIIHDAFLDDNAFPNVSFVVTAKGIPDEEVLDDEIVDVNDNTGLLSLSISDEGRFIVKSMFTPDIRPGRRLALKCTTRQTNGICSVQTVTHELSTQQDRERWFTKALLAPRQTAGVN